MCDGCELEKRLLSRRFWSRHYKLYDSFGYNLSESRHKQSTQEIYDMDVGCCVGIDSWTTSSENPWEFIA